MFRSYDNDDKKNTDNDKSNDDGNNCCLGQAGERGSQNDAGLRLHDQKRLVEPVIWHVGLTIFWTRCDKPSTLKRALHAKARKTHTRPVSCLLYYPKPVHFRIPRLDVLAKPVISAVKATMSGVMPASMWASVDIR